MNAPERGDQRSRILSERVDRFFRTLSLLVEDDEFEKSGRAVDIYFDASDVWFSLQGFPAFYQGKLNRRMFERPRAIVHALLTASWLDRVSLLLPHQQELSNLISLTPSAIGNAEYRRRGLAFVDDVHHELSLKRGKVASIQNLEELVNDMALTAPDKFKILQSLRFGSWSLRLDAMKRNGSIDLSPPKVNLQSMVGSSLYSMVFSSLAARREKREKSNAKDAFALCILAEMVAEFNRGGDSCLPRFYDPTQLFHKTVVECGVEDQFRYRRFHENAPSDQTVFVGEDYLEFKAILQPAERVKKRLPESRITSSATLKLIYEQLSNIPTDVREDRLSDQLRNIVKDQKLDLEMLIGDLERFAFLDTVWLPYLADEDVSQVMQEYDLSEDYADDPQIQQQATDTKEEVEETLVQNTRDFSIMMEIGEAHPKAVANRPPQAQRFAMPDVGVLMYAIPETAYGFVENSLQSLLAGELPSPEEERNALMQYFVACTGAPESTGKLSHDAQQQLGSLVAALWLGDAFELVRRILLRFEDAASREYQLLRLALPLREGDAPETEIAAVQELLGSSESLSIPEQVCSAYVFFSAAKALGYETTSEQPIDWEAPSDDLSSACAKQAIQRSRVDFDKLKKVRQMYAVNMHLYYCAELDRSATATANMETYAQRLLDWQETSGAGWNFRYDDTLARYYRRLALASRDEENWNKDMDLARVYCDRSLARMPDYPLAQSLRETIRREIKAGWSR